MHDLGFGFTSAETTSQTDAAHLLPGWLSEGLRVCSIPSVLIPFFSVSAG